jgi:uncharacterized protein (DUF58 family)
MSFAPTPRAVIAVAAAAPFALVVAVLGPKFWTVGLVWVVFVLLALGVDILLGRVPDVEMSAKKPGASGVGESFCVIVDVNFPARAQIRNAQLALGVSPEIDPGHPITAALPIDNRGAGHAEIWLTPKRRGQAIISRIWLRWTGPLGLVAQQRQFPSGHVTVISPDIRPVRNEGVRLFQRDALHGLIAQLDRGEGSDFEALTEFQAGMDRRAIDWKASARHRDLLAKRFHIERDNQIVFAIDSGRAMSEPLDGIARVDRAVTSALLTAWAALKLGDRVSLYSFDSRPRVRSPLLTGIENFPVIQRHAGEIDYSSDETNHIYALSSLAQQLTRRSLIILFTDFTDPTGADLLVRAMGWLLRRHVVLFVVLRDKDLNDYIAAAPREPADVTRAVTAAALLNEQRAVILRLKRMGLDVLEADHASINLDLINAYIALKQQGRL